VVVAIGFSPDDGARYFSTVQPVTRFKHPWMVPDERNTPIVIAETPLPKLLALWSGSN
jgi:hypothetical protein